MLLLRVVKVAQFFEFYNSKNKKAKFKKFCGLRFAKPTLKFALAIIAYTDCRAFYHYLLLLISNRKFRIFFVIFQQSVKFSPKQLQ